MHTFTTCIIKTWIFEEALSMQCFGALGLQMASRSVCEFRNIFLAHSDYRRRSGKLSLFFQEDDRLSKHNRWRKAGLLLQLIGLLATWLGALACLVQITWQVALCSLPFIGLPLLCVYLACTAGVRRDLVLEGIATCAMWWCLGWTADERHVAVASGPRAWSDICACADFFVNGRHCTCCSLSVLTEGRSARDRKQHETKNWGEQVWLHAWIGNWIFLFARPLNSKQYNMTKFWQTQPCVKFATCLCRERNFQRE